MFDKSKIFLYSQDIFVKIDLAAYSNSKKRKKYILLKIQLNRLIYFLIK